MSAWIKFVKEFARMNNITYGEALSVAAPYYRQHMQGMGYGTRRVHPRRNYY